MRLKSEIWVKAYLRRCAVNGAFAAVVRHGDNDAGAIFIRISRLDGVSFVFGPAPAGMDVTSWDRRWCVFGKPDGMTDREADMLLSREAEFDGDAWIVEVEDRAGRHFLGDELAA